PIVEKRAQQLGIKEAHLGFVNKAEVLADILNRHQLTEAEAAYMGDDLFDLPVLRRVGLAGAPADAHPDVRAEAHWVSQYGGGQGAVREFIELIVKARGQWEQMLSEFVK
ncbi:MAG: HAD hydrolase family protein, partial [Calditrichota bacterium]